MVGIEWLKGMELECIYISQSFLLMVLFFFFVILVFSFRAHKISSGFFSHE